MRKLSYALALWLAFVLIMPCVSLAGSNRWEPQIKFLCKTLKNSNAQIRLQAANLLSELGVRAVSAIPALIQALDDRDSFVKRACIEVLVKMGSQATPAIPALLRILRDKFPLNRSAAAKALGRLRLE